VAKADGKAIGKVAPGTFIVVDVEPGAHALTTHFGPPVFSLGFAPKGSIANLDESLAYNVGNEEIQLTLLPGRSYFFSMDVEKRGAFYAPSYVILLRALPDEEGRRYVNELPMAESPHVSTDQ
jgi:hypothetical protein